MSFTPPRHILLNALAMALAATSVAAPASAAPAVPKGEAFTFTLEGDERVCDFPVQLSGVSGQKLHEGGGVVLATGALVVTVTNLDSDEQRTFNVSGPTLVHPQTGNLVYVGQTLIYQSFNYEPAPSDPFLRFITGRVEQTRSNTIDNISGEVLDVCAALS